MNLDLSGQTALVTGGSRGIGRAVVEALARAGARVAFTYRSSADEADALAAALATEGLETMAIASDAADPVEAERVVARVTGEWGRLDVLVNNAGINRDRLMLRMTEDDWDAVIGTNLKSVFGYSKAAYPVMMRQRSGRIVNMTSVVGVMGNAGQTNYAASKAGIIGFTKSLARELGSRGVTVNAVAPGYVETDMTAAMPDAAKQAMLGSVPLGRPAQPAEIASAVLFLASSSAAYITGHVLMVDGGMAM
jgi:3-oxoacyl-[acyl-carrier protein] reductase